MTEEMCDPQSLVLYVAGDLNSDQQRAVDQHVTQCERCKHDLELMQQKQNEMHSHFPFEGLKENHEAWAKIQKVIEKDTLSSREKKPLKFIDFFHYSIHNKVVYALAAMLVLLILADYYLSTYLIKKANLGEGTLTTDITTLGNDSRDDKGKALLWAKGDTNTIDRASYSILGFTHSAFKGKDSIDVFSINKMSDTGIVEQSLEQNYFPGDRIQFTYSCIKPRYFILVSVEESGTISTLYPQKEDSSMSVEKGYNIALPGSFQLDDYIGKELYIAVFSDKKLSVSVLKMEISGLMLKQDSLEKFVLPATPYRTIRTILMRKAGK